MTVGTLVLDGLVRPDGTLDVPQRLNLPAGKVRVTIEPVGESVQPQRFWKLMESLWADLPAAGRSSRTREEIDADIAALRDEAEGELLAVEQLQAEYRRERERTQRPQE